MSFFSDLFKGNFGNLGHDLFGSPTAIAETLGALALPIGGALLGPELLGSALLPTVGEAAGGLSGAAGLSAEAPASLGAAFGGAGDIAALGADAGTLDTGGGALSFTGGPAAATADPVASLNALAPAANASQAMTPNAVVAGGFQGLGMAPNDVVAGGFQAMGESAAPPSDLGAWMGGIDPATTFDPSAPGMTQGLWNTADPAAASTPLQGPEFQAATPANPNAGGVMGMQSAGGAAQPGGIMGALKSAGGFAKDIAPLVGIGGMGLTVANSIAQRNQMAKLSQQEATAAGNAAQAAQQLQTAVAPMIANGELLQKYLTTGTLPPEFQAQIKQTVDAMKAQIISGYASRGQSTNPQQNSALAQELANADLQAQTLQANLESTLFTAGNQMTQQANQLLSTGLNATQLSAEIPIIMEGLKNQQAAEFSKSLSIFSAALPGSQKFTLTPASATG
jgi:hypothetical protein